MKGGTSWHQACLHPDRHSSSAKMQGAGGMPCAAVLSTLDVSLVILWPGPRTGSLLASPPHRPHGPPAWTTCPQGSHVTPGQPRDPCQCNAGRGSSAFLTEGLVDTASPHFSPSSYFERGQPSP